MIPPITLGDVYDLFVRGLIAVRQIFPLPFSRIHLKIKRLVHFTRHDVVM